VNSVTLARPGGRDSGDPTRAAWAAAAVAAIWRTVGRASTSSSSHQSGSVPPSVSVSACARARARTRTRARRFSVIPVVDGAMLSHVSCLGIGIGALPLSGHNAALPVLHYLPPVDWLFRDGTGGSQGGRTGVPRTCADSWHGGCCIWDSAGALAALR